jgi:hypothetical protein
MTAEVADWNHPRKYALSNQKSARRRKLQNDELEKAISKLSSRDLRPFIISAHSMTRSLLFKFKQCSANKSTVGCHDAERLDQRGVVQIKLSHLLLFLLLSRHLKSEN